jgi:hypothetical protein
MLQSVDNGSGSADEERGQMEGGSEREVQRPQKAVLGGERVDDIP